MTTEASNIVPWRIKVQRGLPDNKKKQSFLSKYETRISLSYGNQEASLSPKNFFELAEREGIAIPPDECRTLGQGSLRFFTPNANLTICETRSASLKLDIPSAWIVIVFAGVGRTGHAFGSSEPISLPSKSLYRLPLSKVDPSSGELDVEFSRPLASAGQALTHELIHAGKTIASQLASLDVLGYDEEIASAAEFTKSLAKDLRILTKIPADAAKDLFDPDATLTVGRLLDTLRNLDNLYRELTPKRFLDTGTKVSNLITRLESQ